MAEPQEDPSWSEQARWLRAMAHPVRLTILNSLFEQPRCVKDINSMIPIGQPPLSQHIAALRRAGLIDCHVSGQLRCYYIVRPTLVRKLMRILHQAHPLRPRDRSSVVRAARRQKNKTVPAPNEKAS